ncbi:MAG: hypothetical protein AAF611_10570 [Bacteroidota bacterium]
MNLTTKKEIKKLIVMGILVVTIGETAEYFLDISPYLLGITRGFGIAALGLILLKLFKSKKAN